MALENVAVVVGSQARNPVSVVLARLVCTGLRAQANL